ncbi:acyltransferase [Nakamurella panacisegetis]|uniref:acyltransferase n=1 Tax=Nakamurella panacisegetis TaxID=1090615 RepID=UPI0018D32A97|nr:acyltransferase [Nakamurella panacisegetis]
MDLWFLTAGAVVNSLLGSTLVPRVIRGLGYRALGVRTATSNIFPGLTVGGRLRNLTIGRMTFLNRDCFIECVGAVDIGEGCQFGPQVTILTSHHGRNADGTISRRATARPVVIGDRVWLGARSVVVPGVTIGSDVAIAAGAVVVKDCLEPGLYAGVPARWVSAGGSSAPEPASQWAGPKHRSGVVGGLEE